MRQRLRCPPVLCRPYPTETLQPLPCQTSFERQGQQQFPLESLAIPDLVLLLLQEGSVNEQSIHLMVCGNQNSAGGSKEDEGNAGAYPDRSGGGSAGRAGLHAGAMAHLAKVDNNNHETHEMLEKEKPTKTKI